MDQTVKTLSRGGADGQAMSDMRTLMDATSADGGPRYTRGTHLEWLAKILIREKTNDQFGSPYYQLCHLILMVDAAVPGAEGRWLAFFGQDVVNGVGFRRWFSENLTGRGAESRGVRAIEKGVEIESDVGSYRLGYGRMPYLCALFEFLFFMDGGIHHEHVESLLAKLCQGPVADDTIRQASNALSKLMREYRHAHIARASHEENFGSMYRFLQSRGPEGLIIIDDEAILDFWACDQGCPFKSFSKAADALIGLRRHFEAIKVSGSIDDALPIGADDDERDISREMVGDMPHHDWISPFDVLDRPPAAGIKFFKKTGERTSFENIAKYGPEAATLPLTILRLDSFGPVQAVISNDLRGKRTDIAEKLACEDAENYAKIQSRVKALVLHVASMQRAALWAIHRGDENEHARGENVVSLFSPEPSTLNHHAAEDLSDALRDQILADAANAFKSVERIGFDDAGLQDEERIAGFKVGAVAVNRIAVALDRYLNVLDARSEQLDQQFTRDRGTFARRLHELYGDEI